MSPHNTIGFENYTIDLIAEMRHKFANEEISSRPVKYGNVVMWLDANEMLHRSDGPAIERASGDVEYWIRGHRR